VQIAIDYCGVCHSDLHQARSEWAGTLYPCVPGHEIVGQVTAIGNQVSASTSATWSASAVWSTAVNSVKSAGRTGKLLRPYDAHLQRPHPDAPGHTLGGYSQQIVVHERYVLHNPSEAQLAAVAPLLCAGITPTRRCATGTSGRGKSRHGRHRRVGAYGNQVGPRHGRPRGGLYHLRIQAEAAKALGADEVVSRNEDEMAAHVKSFDFILNTVAAPHNLDAFTTLLKRDGTLTWSARRPAASFAGSVQSDIPPPCDCGSMIGGIPETQEMLDFCAEHGIVADIELIRGDQINEAWERMVKGDVKYRFVIDSATLAG
jgi:uncharacterized zinc-type alcohol dehydrogenase-like protein